MNIAKKKLRRLWVLLGCASLLGCGSVFADCASQSTYFWLSPFSENPSFADVPLLNSSGTATVYLWGRHADTETITDFSLHLTSSAPLSFGASLVDNPLLGDVDGTSARRFEHTPEVTITDTSVERLQGFTLGNRAVVGLGMGPETRLTDPLYDSELDAWRIASITYTGSRDGALFLQIGDNGILGINANEDITPEFSVVFGDALDSPLCAIDQLQMSSSRADALTTDGVLEATRMETTIGSYWQSDGATLRLDITGGTSGEYDQLIVPGTARLDGLLDLRPMGYADPEEPGASDKLSLVAAAAIVGRFSAAHYDGSILVDLNADPDRLHHHDGGGLFRTLSTTTEEVTLVNHRAVPGDLNGDYEVDFTDFLAFSDNFGELGDWTRGDFNGDNLVAFADFLFLARNFGTSSPPMAQAVPEPSSGVLFILALACISRFRRQRELAIQQVGKTFFDEFFQTSFGCGLAALSVRL